MLIKCSKGMFILKRNFRDAFNEEAFVEAYLEECFDNDSYIVGDIAAGLLRLKGFNNNPNSENYFGHIDKYLTFSCVVGSPYYVLERIKNENEYDKLASNPKLHETITDGFIITPLTKENFDKESLELESNPKSKPHIELDMKKINSLPEGRLPDDLKDDKEMNRKDDKPKKEEIETENTQTYVSSSNGFDPTKVQNKKFFRPNKDNNQKRFKNNKNKNNNNNNNK